MESTDTTTTKKTKPSGNPPAKPGENTATNNNTNTDGSTDTSTNDNSNTEMAAPENMDGEMPAMPECEEGDEDCEMPEPPSDMQNAQPGGEDGAFSGAMAAENNTNTLHPVAYLSLGAGSVILSMVVIYACFSNFFHKKPGQTFDKWQKFMFYCIATVLLAAGLIALCYFLPEWLA